MKFVIVTGLSGAGKTTALKAMEDLGFYCIDNLPGILLKNFADLCFQGNKEFSKVAVGVDVRGREFFKDIECALQYLQTSGYAYELLFLFSDKDTLINRYNLTRRIHPLAEEGHIDKGIDKEIKLLEPLKSEATYLLDTTNMTAKQMRMTLKRLYSDKGEHGNVKLYVTSFGFKRGMPLDADFVFDARFLPNPYSIPELRPHCGKEACVLEYLQGFPAFGQTVDYLYHGLQMILPQYSNSGKNELLFTVGCTGGFHRSVALVHCLCERLRADGVDVTEEHRDIDAEKDFVRK